MDVDETPDQPLEPDDSWAEIEQPHVYANEVAAKPTPYELGLEFRHGQDMDSDDREVVVRVVMTWELALQLYWQLRDQITIYENNIGRIRRKPSGSPEAPLDPEANVDTGNGG